LGGGAGGKAQMGRKKKGQSCILEKGGVKWCTAWAGHKLGGGSV